MLLAEELRILLVGLMNKKQCWIFWTLPKKAWVSSAFVCSIKLWPYQLKHQVNGFCSAVRAALEVKELIQFSIVLIFWTIGLSNRIL